MVQDGAGCLFKIAYNEGVIAVYSINKIIVNF